MDTQLLRQQSLLWNARTLAAAADLAVELETDDVPLTSETEQSLKEVDLCTVLTRKLTPSVANVAYRLAAQQQVFLLAILTLLPPPEPGATHWYDSWGETPLCASSVTQGGILLGRAEGDAPRVKDAVVCYQSDVGISHARWIVRRAAEEHALRFMDGPPT